MSQMFTGNALWHLIMQSDVVSKGVLLVLLVLSIISWSLFFYKWMMLRKKKNELKEAIAQLTTVQTFDDLRAIGFRLNTTIGGISINRNLIFLKSLLETAKLQGRIGLTGDERELLREHAYQIVDDTVIQEESNLPFLSATAAVSPLLGLFGTVWGLVHAFVSISQKQSADIATVAPGIAEALITTLAGLMVAIPALVMFVYLNTMIKDIEQKAMNLADRFILIAHRLMHQ
jgi:biopolymer transport protein TolQ